ncbi:uncharacterized mitochondrial protein AtMg00810-like [Lathyrus oleraceus]|uniref:uncharacterized mitochondrial protein AtMg00810-like n=1 Tax=Pisum sativum TaxID=3888 RepID=UPI0021D1BE41|nr:uncharacterized mitochondrial protein AtMg00810-like [Pisum sativum]
MKLEEDQDNYHENDKNESPTIKDDHQINNLLGVQVYVDDIIFGSTNMQLVKKFSKLMKGDFEISLLGELNYLTGLQIKQLNKGTFMCQTKYCNELLKRFGMEDAKSIDTLISTNGNLKKDENGKDVDVNKYRGMISSRLYLTVSRSDIIFSVHMCSRYQSASKESHLKSVKCILRYLHGTSKYGLWYSKGSDCNLVCYIDSDFSGCKSNMKKANSYCAQILWLKQQLIDFDIKLQCIPTMCDNTSAINLTKNTVLHSLTKHIEIRHHFLHDHVEKGDVVFEHVDS